MANPTKNKYGVYMYVARVPADLVHVVGKKVYSISLGTKDPKEARRLFNEMVAKKEREHTALRAPQESVSYERIVALAGEAYRSLSAEIRQSSGPYELEMNYEGLSARSEDRVWLRSQANDIWTAEGISPDEHSRAVLVGELQKAFGRLSAVVSRMSQGDFSPDENLKRFPKTSKTTTTPVNGSVTVRDLYELWKRDHLAHGKSKATADDYAAIVDRFTKWLKHSDATAISKGEIKGFCDHLLHEAGLSSKTIQGKYLTCIKAIFRAGHERDLITNNPAAVVRQKVSQKPVTRDKGYTDVEARLVLALANSAMLPPPAGERDRRSIHNKRVARWVPWVLCYSGARMAEITQMRREDIDQRDGVHFMRITPEAGSVKTGVFRDVPIHPHLIEMGFLEFVRSCPEGPLFYDPMARRKGTNINQAQWAGNALGRWIADKLGDRMPNVPPNHAWRHRFKTVGRAVGIATEYLDAIQGHSNKNVSASYGSMPISALHRELLKFPKVILEDHKTTPPKE